MARRPPAGGGGSGFPRRPSTERGRGRPFRKSNPSSEVTPRHFFRVIHQNIIEEKKLVTDHFMIVKEKSMPSKLFVKRLGIELSDIARIARLSLRNGKVWEVEVTKDDKNIWFDKGWSDFVEDNSICHRYLLSFEYKGNSNLRVIIFDPSTFEINYPNSDFENENGKAESRTDKMMEKMEERLDLSDENEKDENKNVEVEVYCSEKYQKFFAKASDEIKKAILDADTYKPTNPAFKVLLRPYSINRSFLLVPNSFSAKYMTRVHEEAKLACPNGRKFLVRIRGWGTARGLAFGTGWARICKHNDLKEGGVVINSCMDFLFKIKVFRS